MKSWIILSFVCLAGLAWGKEVEPASASAYEQMAVFTRVLEEVRTHYVDADRATYSNLVQGALRGLLDSLDSHSQYLDAELHEELMEETSGQFGGIGIVVSMKDGLLTIVAPMEDTPGFRAGLLAGDAIVSINGISTEDLRLDSAVKFLRGDPGSKVSLKILRAKTREFKDVEIVRAEIKLKSVKDVRMVEPGIGYLRIIQFNEPTAVAVQEALDSLVSNKLEALVIDLRNNPGGLLNAAVEITGKFLPRGSVIVTTRGRGGKLLQEWKARSSKSYTDFPIAILVNSGSASASEIVAGALQDHQRAVLVGEKTFGKGSVQTILPMEDGAALRLTTAKYYTPSERVIHEHGIEPDILAPMPLEDLAELMGRRNREEMPEKLAEEPVRPLEDVQLNRAVETLRGVLLFRKKR